MHSTPTIIRTPEKLAARCSRARYRFVLNPFDRTQEQLDHFYHFVETPLDKLPSSSCTNRDHLIVAWNALSITKSLDVATLFHLLVVLIETVPANVVEHSPVPDWNLFVRTPSPTASHPRAHKGTKHRLPKNRSMRTTDLRPFLCDRKNIHALLVRMREHWPAALRRLRDRGYEANALSLHAPAATSTCDPYLLVHHADFGNHDRFSMPLSFVQHLLPLIRGCPAGDVTRLLACHWKLSLARRPYLLAAIARWFAKIDLQTAIEWAELLSVILPHRQTALASILAATGFCRLRVTSELRNALRTLDSITNDAESNTTWLTLLSGLQHGLPMEYLLEGIRLGWHGWGTGYSRFRQTASYPADAAEKLNEHVQQDKDYGDHIRTSIWMRCSRLPRFDTIITHTNWYAFMPETALQLLHFWLNQIYVDVDENRLQKKWRYLRDQHARIEKLVTSVPDDYREKLITHLGSFTSQWDCTDHIEALQPWMFRVMTRLCRPPFKKDGNLSSLIARLPREALPCTREIFENAPDASFLHFEKECRTRNARVLIENGFIALTDIHERFAIHSFVFHPKQIASVSKLIGSLQEPARTTILKSCAGEPWPMLSDVWFAHDNKTTAVTRRGAKCFDAAWCHEQFGSFQNESRRTVSQDLLGLYADRVVTALMEGHSTQRDDDALLHAFQLLNSADENRHPLRRFLHAHLDGDTAYRLKHPITRTWMRKHARLDFNLWLNGVGWIKESPKHGSLRLELEKDPIEVLKCGTYVGSCLGLGGICMYSAAAIALDINKQVIYARNAKGSVLARQVLAISKEGEMVCFEVYPTHADTELQEMFQVFDHAFACALGIRLHRSGGDYTIENLLSRAWWDDGSWDVFRSKAEK